MGKVSGIIHVGAHEAEELPSYLVQGVKNIIWIEANPQKIPLLRDRISNFSNMHVANFAAGAQPSLGLLNIANNGQSSSILDMDVHLDEHPDVQYVTQTSVAICRIDDWLDQSRLERSDFNFMNLDIQGYELEALKGAVKQLAYVDFIYSEVNTRHLYKGCPLIQDIDSFLEMFGFTRLLTSLTGHGWGDAFYFKAR